MTTYFLCLNTQQSLIKDRLPATFFIACSIKILFGRKSKIRKSPYSVPTLKAESHRVSVDV